MGHQPMHSPDGRVSVVFNGEIYNFRELRADLAPYPFRSSCDTEVIIAAYLKWGIRCVDRLHGMFAVALYDADSGDLWLIRDRIGKKPLYYWYEGGNLVFASELKPIMAYPGFPRRINQGILGRYLYQQYVKAPESIFEHVYQLEPGSVLKFAKGQIRMHKYWEISEVYHRKKGTGPAEYGEARAQLKSLLESAVRQRMIADVPLGTFLSGGYDSSLVTAVAQSCASEPVRTFSIGFHDEKYDEAGYAWQVAAHLGTAHTELYIDERDMFRLVDSIPRYFDEPFADSSQIPTMLVSELAGKDVTVALSGDGGDEFFCGYNIYGKIAQAQKLDLLGRMTYRVCQMPPFRKIGLFDRLPFKVQVVAGNHDKETKTQLGGMTYIKAIDRMLPEGGVPFKYPIEPRYHEPHWQARRMLLDEETYLPGDILCKVDRATMKYSIEARCPILDVNVMEYSYRLPHAYKYANGVKKRILKDIAYDYIPKSLLDRPKVGFGVPLDAWMRGPLREELLDMCSVDYLKKQGIFDAQYVHDFISEYTRTGDKGPASGANYSKVAWSFFVFQQWYRGYI